MQAQGRACIHSPSRNRQSHTAQRSMLTVAVACQPAVVRSLCMCHIPQWRSAQGALLVPQLAPLHSPPDVHPSSRLAGTLCCQWAASAHTKQQSSSKCHDSTYIGSCSTHRVGVARQVWRPGMAMLLWYSCVLKHVGAVNEGRWLRPSAVLPVLLPCGHFWGTACLASD